MPWSRPPTLDIFEKHADRVRMANIAQTINVLQAMILTDGPKMVLTPTYQVFKMYIPFQGATRLPSDVEGAGIQLRQDVGAGDQRFGGARQEGRR